jgi:hypothetical protein
MQTNIPCVQWIYAPEVDRIDANAGSLTIRKAHTPPCLSYVGYQVGDVQVLVQVQSMLSTQTVYVTDACLASRSVLTHLLLHTLGLKHASYVNYTQTYTGNDMTLYNTRVPFPFRCPLYQLPH